MTRPLGHREALRPRSWLLLIAALVLTAVVSGAGCGETLLETLARHDCRGDAATRVSSTRSAILFIHYWVYVPPGTADHEPYLRFANETVAPTVDDVNTLLEQDGVNIVLALWSGEVLEKSAMAPVKLSSGGFALDDSRVWVEDVARDDRLHVQVHWSPSSTQSNIAGYGGGQVEVVGEPPLMWLGLIENPGGPSFTATRRRRIFAHEFGHYLDLPHNTVDPTNLMDESSDGTRLTTTQIQMMWDSLNNRRSNLAVISCLRDPAVRRIVRNHSGKELLEAGVPGTPKATG
jgi:hypothetical protein